MRMNQSGGTPRVMCRYGYDALDGLNLCSPLAAVPTQRFYRQDQLVSEVQGARRRTLFQHGQQLIAQQDSAEDVATQLLATDTKRSTLSTAYSVYGAGHAPQLCGFNGERADPLTAAYLLGKGQRAFNTQLRRFHSPDTQSPFGLGGMNAYAYCLGDPVNHVDPTGHVPVSLALKGLRAISRVKSVAKPPRRLSTLVNREVGNIAEEMQTTRDLIKSNRTWVTRVDTHSSLAMLDQPGLLHKFVYTRDKQIIMGSFPRPLNHAYVNLPKAKYPSHASFAKYAVQEYGAADEVVSAGYFFKEDGIIKIKNYSGHYRPEFERMKPVQKRLKKLGIEVATVRNDFIVH